MADRIFLSNDTVTAAGYQTNEEVFLFNFASETSVLAASASLIPSFVAKGNGRIVDVYIGVVTPAVSASGFVSGTVDGNVRINSAFILSTNPSITMAGSAGAAGRKATNNGGGTSAVVNAASGTFSTGDMISLDYNARSVGSAAAGTAGTGLYMGVTVRYAAR